VLLGKQVPGTPGVCFNELLEDRNEDLTNRVSCALARAAGSPLGLAAWLKVKGAVVAPTLGWSSEVNRLPLCQSICLSVCLPECQPSQPASQPASRSTLHTKLKQAAPLTGPFFTISAQLNLGDEPMYLWAGMGQFHPETGDLMFNHRTMGAKFDPRGNMLSPTKFCSVKLSSCQHWIVKWIQTIVGDAVKNQHDHWNFWCRKADVRILDGPIDEAAREGLSAELAANPEAPIPLMKVEDIANDVQRVYNAQYENFKLFQAKRGVEEPPHVIQ
jgi:hypothetical protein